MINPRNIFTTILFLTAFLLRTVWHIAPNIEFVTAAMLLSAFYLGKKQSFWLTLAIMVSTDLILGNSNIIIFTWSGFMIPALITGKLFENRKSKSIRNILVGSISGISSTTFFYLWTNFGVWFLGTMYPKTSAGLLMSYINALPFLRMQAISTLFFVPLGFGLTETVLLLNNKYQLEKKFNLLFNPKIRTSN